MVWELALSIQYRAGGKNKHEAGAGGRDGHPFIFPFLIKPDEGHKKRHVQNIFINSPRLLQ